VFAVRGAEATQSCHRPPQGGGTGAQAHSLGEAVRCSENPLLRDEAASTEVASITLDADLPGPLTLQSILPAYHPVEHPWAPTGWGSTERLTAGQLRGSDSNPNLTRQLLLSAHPCPSWPLTHSGIEIRGPGIDWPGPMSLSPLTGTGGQNLPLWVMGGGSW
jgi:hypothetical protein